MGGSFSLDRRGGVLPCRILLSEGGFFRRPDGAKADVDQFDRGALLFEGVSVHAVVFLVEGGDDSGEVAVAGVVEGDRKGDLVILFHVPAVEVEVEAPVLFGNPVFFQQIGSFADDPVDRFPESVPVDCVEGGDEGTDEVVLQVAHEHPGGAEDGGFTGNEEEGDFEFLGDHATVQGPGTTGDDHREFARVVSALDRDFPYALRHVGIDDAVHPGGRIGRGESERIGDFRPDRLFRRVPIEVEFSTREEFRVEVSQDEIRIGACGEGSSFSIAGRSGIGPGALRPHPEESPFIDPPDASSSCPDRVDAEHGKSEAVTVDLAIGDDQGSAVADERGVETGAAHVHRDTAVAVVDPGVFETRTRACGGTG